MKCILCFLLLVPGVVSYAQTHADISFVVSMEHPSSHIYHVEMTLHHLKKNGNDIRMSVWTPGYYEILDYAKAVENFAVTDLKGNTIEWEKQDSATWHISNTSEQEALVAYDVKATEPKVWDVYLDENRGYITPGGLFLYTSEALQHPVTVQIKTYDGWKSPVYTGLDSLPGKHNTFYANNFDVLFDSPILMGDLVELPAFTVKGVPHYFVGYNLGDFDKQSFIDGLQKIVTSATNIIGDIPYTHYTFLLIGPGGGGIEHLNSTSVSYQNRSLFTSPESKIKYYDFLAHEYFHHYNVKRIRPIELGPFDYSKKNYTNLLWVSEGFTVYYEFRVVRNAGLMSEEAFLKSISNSIGAYENIPGHLHQSAMQSSHDTWTDQPFNKTTDQLNRTISYYDKGCVLGALLDLKIRHETGNKKSLDDVMRSLYNEYYKARQRGFTEKEFQQTCERIAGVPLAEEFQYASTVKPVNYPEYFAYAGLQVDTSSVAAPGTYSGLVTQQQLHNGDSVLVVNGVVEGSPAGEAGLQEKDIILVFDSVSQLTPKGITEYVSSRKEGDRVTVSINRAGEKKKITLVLGRKYEKSFALTPMPHPDALQKAIYDSWVQKQ